MKSNQIITIIVAFLIGVLVAMGVTRDNASDVDVNENEAMEESMEEGEETEKAEEESAAPVATNTTPTPAAQPVVRNSSCTPSISGVKDEQFNAIKLNWSTCDSGDFQFYKILKSSTTSSLSHPGSPVVVSSANKNLANHIDKTVAFGNTYNYRACVVERLGKVSCGNTISVTY